jgi:hypothetical protein
MDIFQTHIFTVVDALLIAPFRMPADPMIGFFIGTFCLTLWCAVIGELTLSVAVRLNRRHIDGLKAEIADREMLSLTAHAVGDRESYKALNKQANDAWGRHFFSMAAYSAGMLWPLPFALAWMQTRFAAVAFPLPDFLSGILGGSVGYPFIFIPLYILARFLFGRIRAYLPYFRGVQRMLDDRDAFRE